MVCYSSDINASRVGNKLLLFQLFDEREILSIVISSIKDDFISIAPTATNSIYNYTDLIIILL